MLSNLVIVAVLMDKFHSTKSCTLAAIREGKKGSAIITEMIKKSIAFLFLTAKKMIGIIK